MKLLLAVIILLAFVYTYAYPSYNEHSAEGHDHHGEERDGTREKRSQSEEDPPAEGHVAEGEDHSESSQQFELVEPSFRKRRDTGDHTDETDHSEQDDEEQHHHEKRSGHLGRHDHVQKRHADEHDHHGEEPTFASDDIHQVDSPFE
ncbi:unnamed protein product [Haemonchus placei]|uniref:Secreted phosphoprotein 1 n=1 Tax=Haemonchus placei TaxID=6290 RepID=A0A0N4WAC0_HAEPC|nr:unnamed protein product [Haemonchus placei]